MLIMNQEKEIVRKVYQDLLSYLMESPLTDKFYFYQQVIIEIYRFLTDEREFPLLEEC